MGGCKYYKTLRKSFYSNQVGGREQTPAGEGKVHYCSDPNHSPFDLEKAGAALKDGFAIGEKLTCAGNRGMCPFSQKELDDI